MANILIRINEAENTAQAIGNTRARHMSWISSTHTLLYKEVSNPDDKFDSGIPMFLPSLIGNGMGLRVTQAQHGFELWTPVRYDYANNDWKGALADNGENLAVGIVVNIIGQDTFDIAFFGSYDVGESSLPQGTLFLSPSNAGKYSGTSAPTSGIPQIVAHRTGSKLVVCPTSGIRGADGKRGPAGPQGLPGVDGSDGSEWISGSGNPVASIGRVGSFYLDYDLANVFEKTVEGWQFRVNLKGPKGDGSSSIAWSSIDGKPLAFPPTAHAHTWSDIQGLGDALEGLNTDKLSKSGGTIEGDLLVTQGRVYRPIDPSLMEVNDWQWGFDTDNPNPGAGFEARLQAGIWKDSDGTVMPGLRAYGSMMLYDPRTDRWGCNYQAFAYQSDLSDLIPSSQKGVANGLATLDSSGVIPVSQLPPIVITDTFQVSSESAMLALVAQRGDVCVRSDLSNTFILAAEPASTLANWVQILTPTNSVNGSMTSGKIPKATGSGTLADSLLEDTGTSIIANGLFTVKNADLSVDMLSDNYVGIWYKKYGQKDFFIHTEQNVEKRDLIFSTYNDSGVWDSVALRIARLPAYPNVSGRHFVPKITNTYDLGSDTLRWAALHATSIYRAGTEIGSQFADASHTSVQANSTTLGHVKLYTSTGTSTDGTMDRNSITSALATKETKLERTTLTGTSEFNSYTSSGVHQVSNAATASHFPTGAYGYGTLAVLAYGTSNIMQIYSPNRPNGTLNAGLWVRVCYGGTWQEWILIKDQYQLATVFAGKDSVNVFSQMNTFQDRVVHNATPEYPVTPVATTTGQIPWNNDTTQILNLTSALTGSVTIVITNPREGRVTYLRYMQGSTKRTVALSATGVYFWTPGSTAATDGGLVLSSLDVAGQMVSFRLVWISATIVIVSRDSF